MEAVEESLETAFQSFEVVSIASIDSLSGQPCMSDTAMMVARVMLGNGYEPEMGLGNLPRCLPPRYNDQMPLHYELQFLVECRGNDSHRVDPRASQKTVVSWVNIHYLEGNMTGMMAYLYKEVDLSTHLLAAAVEGTNHHGTWP